MSILHFKLEEEFVISAILKCGLLLKYVFIVREEVAVSVVTSH